jgi:hypothetical protein
MCYFYFSNLGGYLRMRFLDKIEKFSEKNNTDIEDISSIFSGRSDDFGKKTFSDSLLGHHP